MIESISFNTIEQKLIVAFEDGSVKEYGLAEKDQYLIDYPERADDIVAMGW